MHLLVHLLAEEWGTGFTKKRPEASSTTQKEVRRAGYTQLGSKTLLECFAYSCVSWRARDIRDEHTKLQRGIDKLQ